MKIALLFSGILLSSGVLLASQVPQVGDPAPVFRMKGSDGIEYDSASLFGTKPVVLAWFPKAFTGG